MRNNQFALSSNKETRPTVCPNANSVRARENGAEKNNDRLSHSHKFPSDVHHDTPWNNAAANTLGILLRRLFFSILACPDIGPRYSRNPQGECSHLGPGMTVCATGVQMLRHSHLRSEATFGSTLMVQLQAALLQDASSVLPSALLQSSEFSSYLTFSTLKWLAGGVVAASSRTPGVTPHPHEEMCFQTGSCSDQYNNNVRVCAFPLHLS